MNKWINRVIIIFQYTYETRIALFFALCGYWIFYLVSKIFEYLNIVFIWNFADGTGHSIIELDYFFRQIHLKNIDVDKRYFFVRPKNIFSSTCVELYGHMFSYAKASNVLYDVLLPIILTNKKLQLNIATSRQRWELPINRPYQISKPWQTYLYIVTKEEQEVLYRDWYSTRSKTSDFFPLLEKRNSDDNQKEITDFLGNDSRPIALIHIKTSAMNATAIPTDPLTYLDTIKYLKKLDYNIVLAGREKIPKEFLEFGISDYASSSIANFKNDIELFSRAKIAIISGSGINFMADCFKIPYLYINYWHITKTPPAKLCIAIPTLVQQKQSATYLDFREQIKLYYSLSDKSYELFPLSEYNARNASSDEILHATQELVSLVENYTDPSDFQKSMYQKSGNEMLGFAQSRISSYFISKHQEVFL